MALRTVSRLMPQFSAMSCKTGQDLIRKHPITGLPNRWMYCRFHKACGIARSADYDDYIPGFENFGDGGGNWHPPTEDREAGDHYKAFLENVQKARAALERNGKKWKLAGFVWMQGEHEAGISLKMAKDYENVLTGFIAAVRRDLGASSLPFVIGEVNSHTCMYGDVARERQAGVCRKDRNAALVQTRDLSRTGFGGAAHFDADGMVTLGSRFAKAMLELSAGFENAE